MPRSPRAALLAFSLAGSLTFWLPLAARAQTVSIGQRTQAEGLVLPPESAALVEDAAAGTLNPAGIGLMRGMQLEYFHEREILGAGTTGDGLYAAATFFDVLAAGISLEWLRPGGAAAYQKTHWSLAFSPNRNFSLGLGYNVFGSSEAALGALTSWDVGLTWRPWSFVSLAASARDFDNPALEGTGLHVPRRFDGALAFRPFGPRFSLAGDYLFFTDGDNAFLNGPQNGRLGVTAQLDAPDGLSFTAGAGFPLGQNQTSFAQVGIALSTEHVGAQVAYAPADTGAPLGTGVLDLGLRISKESFPTIQPPSARVLQVDLAAALSRDKNGPLALFDTSADDPYEQLLNALSDAANDRGLRAVLFKIEDLGDLGAGRIEELRTVIAGLRGRGKVAVALLAGGGDGAYYLASACDKIFALPLTDFPLHGFAASSLYFAEGLEKIGVHVDVVRVGPYKSAPDALTRNEPSPEQLEVTRALLQDAQGRYRTAVTQSRGVSEAAFQAVLDRGLSTAEELKVAGFIDGVIYPDQIDHELHALLHRPVRRESIDLSPDAHRAAWADLPSIAIINVFGLIAGGESQSAPFDLARTSGAQTVNRALREAADDSAVAAVVVRVDSGGGDGAASELIWRAIQQARRQKPVIISFGDVAASGGYYLAVAGDEILAEPSTITGSIGVFAIKPDLSGLLGKIGVHPHLEASTPNANLFSITAPWSDGEKSVVQGYIDSFYATFVSRVADGRKLTPAQVEAVGRGHVWSGAQAKERGLIDGFGSLLDAVDHAKARAHLERDQQVTLVTYGPAKPLLNLGALGAQSEAGQLAGLARQVVEATGAAPSLLFDAGKPLALPEVLPRIR